MGYFLLPHPGWRTMAQGASPGRGCATAGRTDPPPRTRHAFSAAPAIGRASPSGAVGTRHRSAFRAHKVHLSLLEAARRLAPLMCAGGCVGGLAHIKSRFSDSVYRPKRTL